MTAVEIDPQNTEARAFLDEALKRVPGVNEGQMLVPLNRSNPASSRSISRFASSTASAARATFGYSVA